MTGQRPEVEVEPALEQPPVTIVYVNYKGRRDARLIHPQRMYFGTTDYHDQPQWLLHAFDVAKNAGRTFAMRDILVWEVNVDGIKERGE